MMWPRYNIDGNHDQQCRQQSRQRHCYRNGWLRQLQHLLLLLLLLLLLMMME
jgi:hypothetical protein